MLDIPEENNIYEVPDNDHKLVFSLRILIKQLRIDDGEESPVISANTAIASLKIVRAFILQQDNAEKYITSLQNIEKFVEVRKTSSMCQTNIDTYFS